MPHRVLVTWPVDWLVKRVRDPECSGYWLWPGKASETPAARLELCPPPISSSAVDTSRDQENAVTNVERLLKWRDRDVSLRLAEQPDGTWFGYADVTYWPDGGASQIAHLQFDSLTTDELATLLVSLLAADVVPASEFSDKGVLHQAFRDQCRRQRNPSKDEIEQLSASDLALELSKR